MKHARKSTVMVVDDEPMVREFFATVLGKHNFDVVEADNGREAIKLFNNGGFAVEAIVSDLNMPVMNGLELAKHNSDEWNLPFVMCTAVSDARVALKLLRFGVQDYLVKPVDRSSLIRVLGAAMARNLFARFEHQATEVPSGNVKAISVAAKRTGLLMGLDWIRQRSYGSFAPKEQEKFLNRLNEFLLNAFEHGSLKITEEEKTALLMDGRYEDVIREREDSCAAKIAIEAAILDDDVTVRITDEGDGFDYKKYLNMSEESLIERLDLPNGRGINISASYFDSIEFDKGGSSVLLTKKTRKSN